MCWHVSLISTSRNPAASARLAAKARAGCRARFTASSTARAGRAISTCSPTYRAASWAALSARSAMPPPCRWRVSSSIFATSSSITSIMASAWSAAVTDRAGQQWASQQTGSNSAMVNIEIDGIPIKANNGAMIIEAADEVGIPIARFCYHKKLSVAANCRMCLVEVDKAAKPLPACATPVTEGMKVMTRSPRALDAQRGTMEFLLINHPLDCPICDQGGECDLQDDSMGYGESHSRFEEGKRVVRDKDIGPLLSTEMTRCIHCTRCVRFGEEIAGIKELGAVGRGEHMEIGTYVQKAVTSELSGNVLALCPVGALTSKPFRYTARPWELISVASVAPHDCVGSNIYLHTRGNRVY